MTPETVFRWPEFCAKEDGSLRASPSDQGDFHHFMVDQDGAIGPYWAVVG